MVFSINKLYSDVYGKARHHLAFLTFVRSSTVCTEDNSSNLMGRRKKSTIARLASLRRSREEKMSCIGTGLDDIEKPTRVPPKKRGRPKLPKMSNESLVPSSSPSPATSPSAQKDTTQFTKFRCSVLAETVSSTPETLGALFTTFQLLIPDSGATRSI
ncbi:hypothetical protein D9613_000936 [Agrocybe pediades]|uniref:Uncharacterized protein n=1 Tax=Agrocybe pediades TaxID=84607 RepID=A0A8H4VUY9_9AGAR|nr:hypothetical protein D9613_000936 [Agrocybe pediades]